MSQKLPPGQRAIREFPTFGLTRFARRISDFPREICIEVGGDVARPIMLSKDLGQLSRVEQTTDFHCVTTWSYRSLRWSGVSFIDFYEQLVVPNVQPERNATFVIFTGLDGYSAGLPLGDLLHTDVLLADRLEGDPLPIQHGAPLRLIAPAHYGYKNVKHLRAIHFWRDRRNYQPAGYAFMDHPRARVEFEERGRWLPGRVYRFCYRPLIRPTIRAFRRALVEQHAARFSPPDDGSHHGRRGSSPRQ